ncbi:MAG: hypothetical protein ACE5D7_10265, partial [Fidelibacterota bacterium]
MTKLWTVYQAHYSITNDNSAGISGITSFHLPDSCDEDLPQSSPSAQRSYFEKPRMTRIGQSTQKVKRNYPRRDVDHEYIPWISHY